MAETNRYSGVAIILHWVIAALILGQIAGGLYMHNLPNDAANKFDLYQLHKSFGITVLILTVIRLAWRIGHTPPPLPAHMAGWEKLVARATHWLFYALLFLTPLAGWAMVSVSPTDIPTRVFGVLPWPHLPISAGDRAAAEEAFKEGHEVLAFAMLGLLALHVGAALKHHFINRDGVLTSMAPASVAQVIGVVGVLATLTLGGVFYLNAPKATPVVADAVLETGPIAADVTGVEWTIDKAASRLYFIAREKGKPFEGEFENFDASILFDPADLTNARIEVLVSTASASTGDDLRDSNLPGAEWFDIKTHPTAHFLSTSITGTGDGAYEARGILAIKEFRKEITLPFTLQTDGDDAIAEGEVEIIRTDFGLGANDDWLDEEDVALEVSLKFVVSAQRSRPRS